MIRRVELNFFLFNCFNVSIHFLLNVQSNVQYDVILHSSSYSLYCGHNELITFVVHLLLR